MNTPLTDSFVNVQLTANFWLDELIFSDFYSPRNQEKVLESFYDDNLFEQAKKLAEHLQVIRDYLGCAVSVNIAYRPKWWELKQGRSGASQHVLMLAGDIVSEDHSPKQVFDAIEFLIETGKIKEGGLHAYNSFVHTDTRGRKARW